MTREYCPSRRYYLPIEVIDFDKPEIVKTKGLVERYLLTEENGGMSRKTFAEVRREAYQIYLADVEAGYKPRTLEEELENSKLNWEAAETKIAIKRWVADLEEDDTPRIRL